MPAITKSNQIIPELFAEAVEGAFANQNAFIGSTAKKLGIVKVDGSFPQAGPDKIGSQVSVPYFGSLGEFVSRTDGTPATTVASTMTKEFGTIDLSTLSFELTTWASAPPVPGKSPYEEYARQIMAAAERAMDQKVINACLAGNNQLINDLYSSSTPRTFDYDLMVDSLGLWGDFGSLDQIAALGVHSKTMLDMLKLKDGTGRPLLVQPTEPGVPPSIFGIPLIVSDRLLDTANSTMTAVTSAGTTPPVITLTNTANRMGSTGPCRPINLKVIVGSVTGALGTWKLSYSIDGGATYAAVATDVTSAATVAMVDPLDPAGGLLGVTLNIAAGNAAANNTWTAKSVLKHTSLLMKKDSVAFWFNSKYSGVLQSVPVPQNDSVIYASHLYSVAHRYVRMNGQPYPGVIAIKHNAGGF